jgi:demethylmenaquinone methyltransferase/2-methoxy-6-polyprenyl-1,4-benzoquinol methylase
VHEQAETILNETARVKNYIFTLYFKKGKIIMAEENQEKRVAVESMFDAIAWRYDFLNHFLSFGTDYRWRKKAIRVIFRHQDHPKILDVATGTGDLAIASLKIGPSSVIGIDISEKMLEIGREKLKKRGLSERIKLFKGDSENIEFEDGTFDVTMVAFGVRNFSDPLRGLSEMFRVTRPGGFLMVLEFSRPVFFPFRQLYSFYFMNILPFFGRLFSRDKTAYRYLPDSVMKFPDNEAFMKIVMQAGYVDVKQLKLTGGIASIYSGIKPCVQ